MRCSSARIGIWTRLWFLWQTWSISLSSRSTSFHCSSTASRGRNPVHRNSQNGSHSSQTGKSWECVPKRAASSHFTTSSALHGVEIGCWQVLGGEGHGLFSMIPSSCAISKAWCKWRRSKSKDGPPPVESGLETRSIRHSLNSWTVVWSISWSKVIERDARNSSNRPRVRP